MHIAVDARELCGRPTGVGRYLDRLLDRWRAAAVAGTHRFSLFVPSATGSPDEQHDPLDRFRMAIRVLPGAAGTVWEQVTLPRALAADPPDVLFCPGYTAPLRSRAPIALTIHDASFLAHPEWFKPRERLRRRWLTRASARRAAVVLTDTRFSASEIARHTGVPLGRITCVYPGIESRGPASFVGSGSSLTIREGPRREPLVLFVGTILNRRRLPDLIRAFARAAARVPEARLVIAGENRSYPPVDPAEVASASGVSTRVDNRSYVSEAELLDLYRRARVFVFLSEYEGFGFTPLEALAHGVPAIVLDTPVAREVCGDAVNYVALGDVDATAQWIERLLVDPDAAAPALARAPAVLARYSWDRAAAETLAVLESVAMGTGGWALGAGDTFGEGLSVRTLRVDPQPPGPSPQSPVPSPQSPDLVIVIVSYNAREDLVRCLDSLRAAPPALPHEIIVVDNGSTDGSRDAIGAYGPPVRAIALHENVGFARACNAAIRDTRGELILLLNSDTIVPVGALDSLAAALRARPQAAAMGPRLMDEHGRTELSWGRMVGPFAELVQGTLGRLHARGIGLVTREVAALARRERYVDWVSGACLLVRREDAEAVGLLDERYFMYLEDVDVCAALRARGREVIFTPVCEVVHVGGRSVAAAPDSTARARRRSQIAFYEKHHPRWVPVLKGYLRLKGVRKE